MQDVCINVWNETGTKTDGKTDVMLKVTDICSVDPNDPSACQSPADIKIDRDKGWELYSGTKKTTDDNNALRHGSVYPRPVWWFFSKCYQDVCYPSHPQSTSIWLGLAWIKPFLNNFKQ